MIVIHLLLGLELMKIVLFLISNKLILRFNENIKYIKGMFYSNHAKRVNYSRITIDIDNQSFDTIEYKISIYSRN